MTIGEPWIDPLLESNVAHDELFVDTTRRTISRAG
jgi:hypothetical protein